MHIFSMCIKNIFRKKIRASLCLTGSALCLMLIIAISSTLNLSVYLIEKANVLYEGKIVVVSKNSFFVQIAPVGSALLEEVGEKIEDVEGVKKVVPSIIVYSFSLKERFLPTNITVGIPCGEWNTFTGPIKPDKGGRWPENNSKEVVIGRYLADRNNLTVGSKLVIRNVNFTVVGILSPSLSSVLSYMIMMPLKIAQEIYGYYGIVHMFIVEPTEEISEEELAEKIESEILNVDALTTEERKQFIDPLLKDLRRWSMVIEVFSFIMGFFFITLLSFLNIYERRREIATIDIIGASKAQLILIVVLEVVFLSLIGGTAGVILGLLASFVMLRWFSRIPLGVLFEHIWTIINLPILFGVFAALLIIGALLGLSLAIGLLRKGAINILRDKI